MTIRFALSTARFLSMIRNGISRLTGDYGFAIAVVIGSPALSGVLKPLPGCLVRIAREAA